MCSVYCRTVVPLAVALQLFDAAAPTPVFADVEKDPLAFEDLDATAYTMAARVAVAAQVRQGGECGRGQKSELDRLPSNPHCNSDTTLLSLFRKRGSSSSAAPQRRPL